MQIMFQDPFSSLDSRMTVGRVIAEPLIINKVATGKKLRDRVAELLTLVGMRPEHASRYPHAFSGGQRQRIGIARAIALNPQLIICDEPVSALDVSVQAQVLNLLEDLQRQLNLTYLFISHDLSVVEHIADRVAVMYVGRVVEVATTDQLFYTPKHPYTETLLSAVPQPDPRNRIRPVMSDRRRTEPGEPAVRVLLPPTLPLCAAGVLGGDAGAARHRKRPAGRLPLRRGAVLEGRGRGLDGRPGGRRPDQLRQSLRHRRGPPVDDERPECRRVMAPPKARSGLPLFTGITTYRDEQGRFSFRHPSDWIRDELADDREGVIIRPEADDPDTYFAVWVSPLETAVVADDLPELRSGFDDGLTALPDVTVESDRDDLYGNIVKVERLFTFTEGGATRKRRVWGMYVDTWQVLVSFQGSTVGEYDYWLPMGNYCYATFELPEALWFATDPELQAKLGPQSKPE